MPHNFQAIYVVEDAELTFSGLINSKTIQSVWMEPHDAYIRLILHCVAELYQLEHQSAGCEPDRHLIVKKTAKSEIPKGMVAGILFNGDGTFRSSALSILDKDGRAGSLEVAFSSLQISREKGDVEENKPSSLNASGSSAPGSRPKIDASVARRMIGRHLGSGQSTQLTSSSERSEAREGEGILSKEGSPPETGESLSESVREYFKFSKWQLDTHMRYREKMAELTQRTTEKRATESTLESSKPRSHVSRQLFANSPDSAVNANAKNQNTAVESPPNDPQ